MRSTQIKVYTNCNVMDRLQKLIEDEFKCAICLGLCINANSITCGHVFCSSCLQTWMDRQHVDCPLCRTEIRANGIRPIVTVDHVIRTYESRDENPVRAAKEIFDNLQCCRCQSLSTEPVISECSHVFCGSCAFGWGLGGEMEIPITDCPICNARITEWNGNLVLQSFIEQFLQIFMDLVVKTEVYVSDCFE